MDGGWIGVDLDGTLAVYDGWVSAEHIGDPVPLMLWRVKHWLAEGRAVKIVTARVHPGNPDAIKALESIVQWILKYIGQPLEVTHEKDFSMIELWDDRAVQVDKNTGLRADGQETPETLQAVDEINNGAAANVIPFSGGTYGHVPPVKVALGAARANLESILVIGYDAEGEFYMASSDGDPREFYYLIEWARRDRSIREFIYEDED